MATGLGSAVTHSAADHLRIFEAEDVCPPPSVITPMLHPSGPGTALSCLCLLFRPVHSTLDRPDPHPSPGFCSAPGSDLGENTQQALLQGTSQTGICISGQSPIPAGGTSQDVYIMGAWSRGGGRLAGSVVLLSVTQGLGSPFTGETGHRVFLTCTGRDVRDDRSPRVTQTIYGAHISTWGTEAGLP